MNERIRELRTQAAAWVAENHQPQDPNAYSQKEIDQRYLMYEEKFAELIVRECARRCMDIASEEALKIAEINDGRDTFAASIATAGKIGRKIGLEFDLFGVEE